MLLLLFALSLQQDRPDILFEDFEGDDYGRWTATGAAFGNGPARGTLPGQMAVEGFHGHGLASSFHGGDRSTGTLTSPEFSIERKYISFLIGGGGFERKTCVNLEVGGKVVRTATGLNTQPGGNERLSKAGWDVSELIGKSARIVVADAATAGWGHINIDHIVFTDEKPPATLGRAERLINADRQFLLLPIKNGGPMRSMRILVDGEEVRAFDIELADGPADWKAELDISPWKGKALKLIVDRLPEDSHALSNVASADTWSTTDLYREKLRPLIHFSPKRGWNNDPNGLVYFNNTFHLFFQHNPYGVNWGNMHWGHATSRDLLHWTELGEALYPDAMGPMFSGSGVVDSNNTSGFGADGKPPIVLIYTAAGVPAVQCLAYSTDEGNMFTKYAGNPVVKQFSPGNRDPKVIWHEPTKRWAMVLYVEKKPKHTIHFLSSPNLKDWRLESEIDGFFECPDLFELPVEGTTGLKKWVLTAADHRYMLGAFDGKKFTPETPLLPGHRGKGFYAAQTYGDFIETAGSTRLTNDQFLVAVRSPRRVQFGWMQAPSPGMPFSQCMSLPLELSLKTFPRDGVRLAFKPAREMKTLRRSLTNVKAGETKPFESEALEVEAILRPKAGSMTTLEVRGLELVYDANASELRVGGLKVPIATVNGRMTLDVFVDRTATEIFANDGWIYVPLPFTPDAANRSVRIGGEVQEATVHELKSIWDNP